MQDFKIILIKNTNKVSLTLVLQKSREKLNRKVENWPPLVKDLCTPVIDRLANPLLRITYTHRWPLYCRLVLSRRQGFRLKVCFPLIVSFYKLNATITFMDGSMETLLPLLLWMVAWKLCYHYFYGW